MDAITPSSAALRQAHGKKLTITLMCMSAEYDALKIHALANHPAVEKLIVVPCYQSIGTDRRGASARIDWNTELLHAWAYYTPLRSPTRAEQQRTLFGYDATALLKEYQQSKIPAGAFASWIPGKTRQGCQHSTKALSRQVRNAIHAAAKNKDETLSSQIEKALKRLNTSDQEYYEPPAPCTAISFDEIEASDLICSDLLTGFDNLARLMPKGRFLNRPDNVDITADKTTLPELAAIIDKNQPPERRAFPACRTVSTTDELKAFMKEAGSPVVVKEYDSIQGRGIYKVQYDAQGALQLMNNGVAHPTPLADWLEANQPVLAMQWLQPAKGDVRVLCLDGTIIGAYNRLPAKGSELCNRAQGGSPAPYHLSRAEELMIKRVCDTLNAKEQRWAGLDLMADETGRRYISEINLSNSGGLNTIHDYSLSHYGGKPAAERYANAIVALARQPNLQHQSATCAAR